MTIYYNAQDRKPLVKAISEFTGADAVYLGGAKRCAEDTCDLYFKCNSV